MAGAVALLAASPAAGQSLPPLSYHWAAQAPDAEIADRVLGPLASLYRDVSGPGSGNFSRGALTGLHFATAPRSAGMPGLCESEVVSVRFMADPVTAFVPPAEGGLEDQPAIIRDFSVDTRFAVASDTAPAPWSEVYEAAVDAACEKLTDGWEFIHAPDAVAAWLAVRATTKLALQARADPASVGRNLRWCGGEKCDSLPEALAGLDDTKLHSVRASPCEAFSFDLTTRTRDPRFKCLQLVYILGAVANEFDRLEIALRLDTGAERAENMPDPSIVEFGAMKSTLIED